jgi:hypothetical protein
MTAAAKLRWYMHRMRAMTPVEVGHRVAEKCRHATQETFLRRIASAPWQGGVTGYPALPDPSTAPHDFRARLAEDAALIGSGHWRLFGWQDVSVATPPAWHRDPVSGITVEAHTPAHRLNHRHLPPGADARRIWEINRWGEISRLGMAGWVGNDCQPIALAQQWLSDWCQQNPVGRGINWTSPLEAALRLINFTWFDAFARACGASPAQDDLAARIVPMHASWIWRHRSFGSSANNHLLGELAAIVIAAGRWPGVAAHACSAEAAWHALSAEVLRQFAADGSSREQALHYHLFAFDLAWLAASAIGCRSGPAHDRLLRAARFFRDMSPAHGWDFGDSDDAQVLPLAVDRSHAALEWKEWLSGAPGSMQFWLGAPPPPSLPDDASWTLYPDAGMAAASAAGWHLRLDASPLGFGPLAAHGHCDALHLSLWDGAQPLIIDPGTGGYFGMADLRARLASWDAHNGPRPLHGYATPQRVGVFLQIRHHAAPKLQVADDAATATFDHGGHSFTRRVSRHAAAILIDDAEAAQRPFRVRWQFPPQTSLVPAAADSVTVHEGSRRWTLRFEGSRFDFTVIEAPVSPAYGQSVAAPAVEVTAHSGRLRTIVCRMA